MVLFGNFEQNRDRRNEQGVPVAIEDVFPDFFNKLPEKFQYLNNLTYLKQSKIIVAKNKITLFDKEVEHIIGYVHLDKVERQVVNCEKSVDFCNSFYYVYDFGIFHLFVGKSYGSLLIELVNRFLLDNKKNACLENDVYLISAVNSSVIEARGRDFQFGKRRFYANHGWEALDGGNNMQNLDNGKHIMVFDGEQDLGNFKKFKSFLLQGVMFKN